MGIEYVFAGWGNVFDQILTDNTWYFRQKKNIYEQFPDYLVCKFGDIMTIFYLRDNRGAGLHITTANRQVIRLW